MLLIHFPSFCIALTTVLLGVMHNASWWPSAATIWGMLQSAIRSTIEASCDDDGSKVLRASVIPPSPSLQALDDKTRYACACRILVASGPHIRPTEQSARMEAPNTAGQHSSTGFLVSLATFMVFITALYLIDQFQVDSTPKLNRHIIKASSARSTTPRGTMPGKVAVDSLLSYHEQERTCLAQPTEIKKWTVETKSIFAGEKEDSDIIVNMPLRPIDSGSVKNVERDDHQLLTRAAARATPDDNAGSEAEAFQSVLLPELLYAEGTTEMDHRETWQTFLSALEESAPGHDRNQLDELHDDSYIIPRQPSNPGRLASTDSAADTEKSLVLIEEAETTHRRMALQPNAPAIQEQVTSVPAVDSASPQDTADGSSPRSRNAGDIIAFAADTPRASAKSNPSVSPRSEASTDSISHFKLDQTHCSRSPSPSLPASIAESASLAIVKTRPSLPSSLSSTSCSSCFGGFQDETGRWNIDRAASLPFGVRQGKRRRNRRRPRKGRARRKQHKAEAKAAAEVADVEVGEGSEQ